MHWNISVLEQSVHFLPAGFIYSSCAIDVRLGAEAECRTCVFPCVSQVSTFEYVLRETRVAPRRWKTNLASGANRTLRI